MKAVIKRQDLPGLVILAVIGLGLTFLGSVKLMNAMESKKWPTTNGTVTSSQVGGAIKYYPSVKYSYTVDSTVYSSDRIANMNFSSKKRSVAEEVIKKYPLNSEIKVYYDNEDPSSAILEPGIKSGNFLLLAAGILILAIPVLCAIFMKLEIRKENF